MKIVELEKQIQSIRHSLQGIYQQIKTNKSTFLPSPDASVIGAGEYIQQEQYDVVVCGQFKKGKSSFINALLGEEVLPVATEVATAQVFRVINSDTEDYNLVFNNGERMQIAKTDLAKYGSQVEADLMGKPAFKDKQIDYIEVKHPIPFLPKSIALVDTPGFGALYAAHEQITRNYLKKAAAVIFITDPENPITIVQKEFVESALKQTKQILFILTKMDNYNADYIRTIVSENQRILAPLAPLTATRQIQFYPMSSKVLNFATKMKNDKLVEKSQFDVVKEALLKLIYNTVGFDINVRVFNTFNHYYNRVKKALDELHTSASQPGKAKELAEQKRQMQQTFAAEWGNSSTKQQEMMAEIEEQIIGLRNYANDMLSTSHHIYDNMLKRIESLDNNKEADQLANSMSYELQQTYANYWKDLVEDCQCNIDNILSKFNARLGAVDAEGASVQIESYQPKKMGFAGHISNFRNGYMTGSLVTGLGVGAAIIAGTVFAAPVVLLAGSVAALFGGIFAGFSVGRENKLNQKKQELKAHLSNCLQQAYSDIIRRPTHGNLTELQNAERILREAGKEAVALLYAQHKENIDRQVQLLDEQLHADAETRQRKLQEIESAKQVWIPVYNSLKSVKEQLVNLEKSNE